MLHRTTYDQELNALSRGKEVWAVFAALAARSGRPAAWAVAEPPGHPSVDRCRGRPHPPTTHFPTDGPPGWDGVRTEGRPPPGGGRYMSRSGAAARCPCAEVVAVRM